MEDYGKLDKTEKNTIQAIKRQLNAMKCRLYEIGIRDVKTGKMMNYGGPQKTNNVLSSESTNKRS